LQRREHADQHGAALDDGDFLGFGALYLEDDVSGSERLALIGGNMRTGGCKGGVGKGSASAGAGFDDDLVAHADETLNGIR
jgi:hypothetical protein